MVDYNIDVNKRQIIDEIELWNLKIVFKIDIKVNAHIDENKLNALEQLLREYMDIFAWTSKDLTRIPLKSTPTKIELVTSISY